MRYFIGFLVTIGLLIILTVLLFTGGNGGKSGDVKHPLISAKPKTLSELAAYADTSAVARLILDGQINADQTHVAIRITVGKDDVTYEQIQGYDGVVVNRQDFANNQNSYRNFLYAIGRVGFTNGDDNPNLANSTAYCPLGQRYTFDLMDGDHVIQRYWASSCNGQKTYKGNLPTTLSLFKLQVPNYGQITQHIQWVY